MSCRCRVAEAAEPLRSSMYVSNRRHVRPLWQQLAGVVLPRR